MLIKGSFNRQKPQQATCDVDLSVDEQAVLLKQDRKEIFAFLDIPFKNFDSLDTTGTSFDLGDSRMRFEEEAVVGW
ncbi:hypothetical protein ACO0K9_11340 [Undibacterium sp. Ji50W]|uniref:hypothetical protein n=1 Tax=Undibacterium sp. Ji50W TaxID=3413041 RepID=UPI003BF32505